MKTMLGKQTYGGKGNKGMFFERNPNICAAGLATSQPDANVGECFNYYTLQHEVDALLGDAIKPAPKSQTLPPLRRIRRDMRNSGIFNEAADLINPPTKSKFQSLVHDLKETVYNSYWKKAIGRSPCRELPPGFNIDDTTMGKKNIRSESLYNVIFPVSPIPDKTPTSKEVAYQTDRNYNKPHYDRNIFFGIKSNVDKRGTYMKNCLTDDKILQGRQLKTPMHTLVANNKNFKEPKLGVSSCPNNNISCVPQGYAFGKLTPPDNLSECLTNCKMKECLAHLNLLRKCLSKRNEATVFRDIYLRLKRFDSNKTGWLPKDLVYDECGKKYIRFNTSLIEPLLSLWKTFDGSQIQYETFVRIINYREPSPELPKIRDVPDECDYRTTYSEMVKEGQEAPKLRAGLPSGRYFDMDYPFIPEYCCKAHRVYLPQESDSKSCLNPSVLSLTFVDHRDMYEKRDPHIVRRVFEGSGLKFTDAEFDDIWEKATKYHSEGWVCYETFRRVLKEEKKVPIKGVEKKD